MYKQILQSIEGIGIFPMISLVIFVVFFAAIFMYVIIMKKSTIEELKNMPLQSSSNEINEPRHG